MTNPGESVSSGRANEITPHEIQSRSEQSRAPLIYFQDSSKLTWHRGHAFQSSQTGGLAFRRPSCSSLSCRKFTWHRGHRLPEVKMKYMTAAVGIPPTSSNGENNWSVFRCHHRHASITAMITARIPYSAQFVTSFTCSRMVIGQSYLSVAATGEKGDLCLHNAERPYGFSGFDHPSRIANGVLMRTAAASVTLFLSLVCLSTAARADYIPPCSPPDEDGLRSLKETHRRQIDRPARALPCYCIASVSRRFAENAPALTEAPKRSH
jgi:hypothetical protein